jgi:hypothetical protein
VDRNPVALKEYLEDPAHFVARWEETEGPRLNETENVSGHRFTEEERRALSERDYGALYAMGANSFMLWTLFLPLLEPEYPSFRELVNAYNARIRPYGRPDSAT